MKLTAQIISWVFLPLFMPVLALAFALYVPSDQNFYPNIDCLYTLPADFKEAVLGMFFIFCVVTPGISFIIMKRSGILHSIEMDQRKERDIPILTMMAYCLMLYFLLYTKLQGSLVSKFVFSLPLSGVFVTLTFFFLNRWKKISIHAASAGILFGFLLAYVLQMTQYSLWPLILAVLFSGVVMSARLYLQKHDLTELIIGWCVGCFITFGVNFLY